MFTLILAQPGRNMYEEQFVLPNILCTVLVFTAELQTQLLWG